MRGQALSGSRKLNKHWQSGDDSEGFWFSSITYQGAEYIFAPWYRFPDEQYIFRAGQSQQRVIDLEGLPYHDNIYISPRKTLEPILSLFNSQNGSIKYYKNGILNIKPVNAVTKIIVPIVQLIAVREDYSVDYFTKTGYERIKSLSGRFTFPANWERHWNDNDIPENMFNNRTGGFDTLPFGRYNEFDKGVGQNAAYKLSTFPVRFGTFINVYDVNDQLIDYSSGLFQHWVTELYYNNSSDFAEYCPDVLGAPISQVEPPSMLGLTHDSVAGHIDEMDTAFSAFFCDMKDRPIDINNPTQYGWAYRSGSLCTLKTNTSTIKNINNTYQYMYGINIVDFRLVTL